MSEPSHSEEEKIALQILAYLKEHPQAKDTIEGISQWWLGSGGRKYRPSDVERAVFSLLSRDLLVST